jgi:hypothetical protein
MSQLISEDSIQNDSEHVQKRQSEKAFKVGPPLPLIIHDYQHD